MGLLTNRDPMQRAANFGPMDLLKGGATAAATGGTPWGAILAGGAVGLGALGDMMGQGQQADIAEQQRKLAREQEMIRLLEAEMKRQQTNRQLGGEVPLRQQLMRNILDPTANTSGRLAANVTPRTYQSGTPGVPSMTPPTQTPGPNNMAGMPTQGPTQYGAPASPEQLAQLIPNFSQFAGQSQKATQMTAGITPGAYQTDSTLPLLNQFGLTRGSYLSNDNGINEAGEEGIVNQLAQGHGSTQVAPGGRAPFRGLVSPIPQTNERGDGFSDQDIKILNEAQKSGMSPVELEMLKRQLRGDGK